MRRWQAEVIFWTLWSSLLIAAGVADAYPRYAVQCLVIGGTGEVSAFAFLLVASWRGWVRSDD